MVNILTGLEIRVNKLSDSIKKERKYRMKLSELKTTITEM